jgi:hypothetical protein
MEITQIKEQLTMSNVLHYYGLKTDNIGTPKVGGYVK